jgi:shikimate dehydrogenase
MMPLTGFRNPVSGALWRNKRRNLDHIHLFHTNMPKQHCIYGLIGYPLGHSFSAAYFAEKFAREGIANAEYRLFPLKGIEELPDLLKLHPEIKGLNVTIPYKQKVLPYLADCLGPAKEIGAVNAIAVTEQGLIGTNTDAYGFEYALAPWLLAHQEKPDIALVLGTGGAAAAVGYVLRRNQMPYHLVSRNAGSESISYAQANQILASKQQVLVVQTTPVGMAPNIECAPPIDLSLFCARHFVFDLIYNPAETILLQRAAAQGAITQNGLEMLYQQAEAAWNFWEAYTYQ